MPTGDAQRRMVLRACCVGFMIALTAYNQAFTYMYFGDNTAVVVAAVIVSGALLVELWLEVTVVQHEGEPEGEAQYRYGGPQAGHRLSWGGAIQQEWRLLVVTGIAGVAIAMAAVPHSEVEFLVAVRNEPMLQPELHVTRDVESTLRALVGVPDPRYVVVFGARGCGTTHAVLGATAGIPGVLRIRIIPSIAGTETSLIRDITAALPGGHAVDMSVDQMARVLAKAGEELGKMSNGARVRVPTIMVELESGTRGDARDVATLFRQIKLLNSDSQVCRVIIILSDPTDVHSLPADGARQLKVFVDDFTEAEAREMLRKRGVLNATRQTALIAAVGTRASELAAVMQWQDEADDAALQAYLANREWEANQQLKRLARDKERGTAVLSIYRSIADSVEAPHQVRLTELAASAKILDIPEELARLMKARDAHVLLYHPAEGAYRFLNVFHERAVAQVLAEAAATEAA